MIKVVHLPTTTGGNSQNISRNLRALGLYSESWTVNQNYIEYPTDKILDPKGNLFWRELAKIFALTYVFKFDLVFFNFGTGLYTPYLTIDPKRYGRSRIKKYLGQLYSAYSQLMAFVEVYLLNLLRKPIFIQYQGDDARQGDYCISNYVTTFARRVETGYYSDASDLNKRKRIRFYGKHAKKIYALNPDLLYVLPPNAEFLPYSHISLKEWPPVFGQTEARPLRIGHAPSHRLVKGTDLILQAVAKLKKYGYQFEFILVENKRNQEAKEIYKTIDILVDQLFAGWYGGLAVEAMALGKPVVAYIRPDDLRFIPVGMAADLPIIKTAPDSIYETLVEIVTMPRAALLEIALKSREYVERWHDPMDIAMRIEVDIKAAFEATS